MSRLTKKISKTVQDKYSLGSYLCYDFSNTDNINELLNKLGRIEDFMEDNEWNSIEEMKLVLQQCEKKYCKMQRDYEELKHCIWKDTPIEQIKNNYERGHNFDFVGVAYNRGKEKTNRKVRKENQALKNRWEKLKSWIDYCSSGCLDYDEILQKMKELEEEE